MTDDVHPHDDPSNRDEGSAPSGEELDRLLAEAADLSAQVTAEVGVLPVRSRVENVALDSLETDNADIREKLNDVDRLLHKTASELGVEPCPQTASPPPPSPAPAAPDIPDFMSEFTQPQQPTHASDTSSQAKTLDTPALASEKTEPQPASTPPPVVPEFMAEFTQPDKSAVDSDVKSPPALTPPISTRNPPRLGVVGAPVKPIEVNAQSPDSSADAPALSSAAGQPVVTTGGPEPTLPVVPTPPPKENLIQSNDRETESPSRWSEKILPLATLMVRAMEQIDRPLERLGHRPRQIIGILALLMIAASMILFFASLL